jgi:hypothetical protein
MINHKSPGRTSPYDAHMIDRFDDECRDVDHDHGGHIYNRFRTVLGNAMGYPPCLTNDVPARGVCLCLLGW